MAMSRMRLRVAAIHNSKHSLYRKNRLEINVASNQVKKISAIKIPKLNAGARRSRGGINRTSVNSFSGGHVTLSTAYEKRAHTSANKVKLSTSIRAHFFLGDFLPEEGCSMDLAVEGEVSVKQPASGGTAACIGDAPVTEYGKLRSSTSSSAKNRYCKG